MIPIIKMEPPSFSYPIPTNWNNTTGTPSRSTHTRPNHYDDYHHHHPPPRRHSNHDQRYDQQRRRRPDRDRNTRKERVHKRGRNSHRHNSSNYKNHRHNNPRRNRGNHQQQQNQSRRRSNHHNRQNQDTNLRPIHVSKSSIHNDWKTELGGIIRYYINSYINSKSNDVNAAMREIEQMYYKSGCDVQKTKHAILSQFGCDFSESASTSTSTNGSGNPPDWVDISMAIECGSSSTSITPNDTILQSHSQYTKSNEGILLHKQQKAGDGPAHAHESWTNVIVPSWAVGKSYFFQMTNKTQLNLSCEMTIDGHSVARNVPLPPNSVRFVRPDGRRYFETHKWVIRPAKKFALKDYLEGAAGNANTSTMNNNNSTNQSKRGKERYNGLRPNYNNQRVDDTTYPDPTIYGWTFTGSNETSKVEFFEKECSNFGTVRMDFYYTTATVKTILDHPTTGMNSLFRRTIVDPEKYIQILNDPRSHTDIGYRRRHNMDHDTAMNGTNMSNNRNNDMNNNNEDDIDSNMNEDESTRDENQNWNNYYAKNDNYDFQNDGHTNRASAMSKLEQTGAYSAWEDAARKEWACIHAKFYVSLPKKNHLYNGSSQDHTNRRRRVVRSGSSQQQELPEQAPVVDIKAAERATLGTHFHATGPSEPKRRSKIVMKRINGLNEDETRRSAPIFEYKLYYRAEEEDANEDDMMDDEDDDEADMDADTSATTNAEPTPAEALLNENDLVEYKQKKVEQVQNWHRNCTFEDEEEASLTLLNRLESINKAASVALVDSIVLEYYQWLQKQQWNRRQPN